MAHYGISTAAGTSPSFGVFLIASLLLAVTPGPGVLYLITRTLSHGRLAGLQSIGGIAIGNLANAALAACGLAAILAVSAAAFTVVKFAGAAYLILLGVRALRRPAERPRGTAPAGEARPASYFRDAFLVALLNPKTALFFAAFLPQFLDPNDAAIRGSLYLSGIFVAIAAATDTLYVLAADALAPMIVGLNRAARAAGRYLTAAAFLALGLFVALGDSRSAR